MRTEVRAPFGPGCAGLGTSCPSLCRPGSLHRAFSLIELIGVLAVMAILAAVLAPSFVRQMDKTSGDQESATLKSFGDALQASIMRNRYIPSAVDWATTVATELGVDLAAVTTNPRRQPRFFLIDPGLNINNTGVTQGGDGAPVLPYTQNNAGSANVTNSSRVLIISSVGVSLPAGVVSGVPTAADFTAIWTNADQTVPPAPVFSGWTGGTNDLKVERVNLSPLFVHVLLSQNASVGANPRYSIDSTNWASGIEVPKTNSIDRYFLQNSVLALYENTGSPPELDSQQIMIRDNSFVYDQNVWRGSIGGEGFLGGLDIASVVDRFLTAYPNVQAQNGTNQQAIVVQKMINFMDRYDVWAAAGFPGTGSPTYVDVNNAQTDMIRAVQDQYLGSHNPNPVACQ